MSVRLVPIKGAGKAQPNSIGCLAHGVQNIGKRHDNGTVQSFGAMRSVPVEDKSEVSTPGFFDVIEAVRVHIGHGKWFGKHSNPREVRVAQRRSSERFGKRRSTHDSVVHRLSTGSSLTIPYRRAE